MQQRGDRKALVKTVIESLSREMDMAKDLNLITDELYFSYKSKIVDFSSGLFSNYSDDKDNLTFTEDEWNKINIFINEMILLNFIRERTKKNIHFILNEVIL